MRFDIMSIFPEFFGGPLDYGIVRRAREARLIETHVHDLREFTHDRHRDGGRPSIWRRRRHGDEARAAV